MFPFRASVSLSKRGREGLKPLCRIRKVRGEGRLARRCRSSELRRSLLKSGGQGPSPPVEQQAPQRPGPPPPTAAIPPPGTRRSGQGCFGPSSGCPPGAPRASGGPFPARRGASSRAPGRTPWAPRAGAAGGSRPSSRCRGSSRTRATAPWRACAARRTC